MYTLSNSTRSDSIGKAFSDTSYSKNDPRQNQDKYDLIKKARSIPILDVLANYNLYPDVSNKLRCPFSFHSNRYGKDTIFSYLS